MATGASGTVRPAIEAAYGHRIRVRVGALLFDPVDAPASLLLVEHAPIHGDEVFWTPAGGGVQFGEGLAEALRREVLEEVGLGVRVGALRYVLDFVRPPLHAVSFYFEAQVVEGHLAIGRDPELGAEQLIRSARFVAFEELAALTVYPLGLARRLLRDVETGFREGTQYLGTLR